MTPDGASNGMDDHTQLEHHDVLGRMIRSGSWDEQGVATYRRIVEAIEDDRWPDADRLCDYFVVEAKVCYDIYRQWTDDIIRFLVDQGVAADDIDGAVVGLRRLLAHPDGRPFDPIAQWQQVHRSKAAIQHEIRRHDRSAALEELDVLVEAWRQCHDRDVDTVAGLMNEVIERLGEAALGEMYDAILVPWFDARYSLFDIDRHDWPTAMHLNVQVAFEAMRGHLCGPQRRGDVGVEETDDRIVLSFDPCGSGGRQVRGDDIEGTAPRHEAPYRWRLTSEPAALNHFEPGVCAYCAHCILLTEVMPMRAFGYPVRAVDPPRPTPDRSAPEPCRWTVFKDPTAVPDEYYRRVGMTKPDRFGSEACGGNPTGAA